MNVQVATEKISNTGKDFVTIVAKKADGKLIESTKGGITKNIVVDSNTVKFTQCLETYPTVQNIGGKIQGGILLPNARLRRLTVLEKLRS